MPARPRDQWKSIFETQTDGSPKQVADRIIKDLWGYGSRTTRWRDQDVDSLANALEAYVDRLKVAR